VLSLAPAAPQLDLGETTTVRETFENDGTSAVKGLKLTFRLAHGWRLKRLGPARAKRVAPGHRFTVPFRITAPSAGPSVTLAPVTGGATFDPPAHEERRTSAVLSERVFAAVPAPFELANTTSSGATFGARDGGFAISAKGAGVLQPIAAAPVDSYAAIYERQRAAPSSTAQVTVTSDPAGGTAGGAGLIEREAMTAPAGSPPCVALFINGSGSIVMSWNASGGPDIDSRFGIQNVIVHVPVTLRLVRDGSTYTGYYSTNLGATWSLVDTVTVASGASAGNQDVGMFHASGLSTWTTTATFTNLLLQ
jgi:alpha-N-acetylglucosaminidase